MANGQDDAPWRVADSRAELVLGSLRAVGRLSRASDGWQVELGGITIAGRFWQLRLAALSRLVPQDVYVRGDDLIATYGVGCPGVRPQVYWRAGRSVEGPAVVELIFSVQTDQRDSDPRATLRTWLAGAQLSVLGKAGEILPIEHRRTHLDAGQSEPMFVFRGSFGTYLEMVYPADFIGVDVVQRQGRQVVTWRVFEERLEKGVIRRTRVRGVFSSSPVSQRQVQQIYAEFCNQPLPLAV